MKSCITISLVDEARGGPFVFWDGLEDGCRRAADLGFDAVEVFPPGPDAIQVSTLQQTLQKHELKLAAVGTGGGWVRHQLTLTHASADRRQAAVKYVEAIIQFAGQFRASAIIGSMQGRHDADVPRDVAMDYLKTALDQLGPIAAEYGVPLIYEPLNRYETNLCNSLADGCELLNDLENQNVVLLADLFHMNIEEARLGDAIRRAGHRIGHVHFVDSNRQPVGAGHLNLADVIDALRAVSYDGYLSAEALPLPNPMTAAQQTIQAFRRWTSTYPLEDQSAHR